MLNDLTVPSMVDFRWETHDRHRTTTPFTLIGLTERADYARLAHRWLNLHIRWRPWLWVIPALLILILAIRQQLTFDLLANPAG